MENSTEFSNHIPMFTNMMTVFHSGKSIDLDRSDPWTTFLWSII